MRLHYNRSLGSIILCLFLILPTSAFSQLCPYCQTDNMAESSQGQYLCTHCLATTSHKLGAQRVGECICPGCISKKTEQCLPFNPPVQNTLIALGGLTSSLLFYSGHSNVISTMPLLAAYAIPKIVNYAIESRISGNLIRAYQELYTCPYTMQRQLIQLTNDINMELITSSSYLTEQWAEEFMLTSQNSTPGTFNKIHALLAMIYTWHRDPTQVPTPESDIYQAIKPHVFNDQPTHSEHTENQYISVAIDLKEIIASKNRTPNDVSAMRQHPELSSWLEQMNNMPLHRPLMIRVQPDNLIGIKKEEDGTYLVYNPLHGIHRANESTLYAYIKGICDLKKTDAFLMDTLPEIQAQ